MGYQTTLIGEEIEYDHFLDEGHIKNEFRADEPRIWLIGFMRNGGK